MACEATGNLLKGIRRSRRTWSKGRVWNAWQERTRQWTLFTGLALEPRSGSLFSREDLEAESGPCSLRRYTTVRVPMKEDKFSGIRVSVSEEGRWNWALMPSQILASAATFLIKVAQLSFLWCTSPRCAAATEETGTTSSDPSFLNGDPQNETKVRYSRKRREMRNSCQHFVAPAERTQKGSEKFFHWIK